MKSYPNRIRIFKNPILESFTIIHPVVPIIFWTPVILYLYYLSIVTENNGLITIVFYSVFGLLAWTLTEYLLHRFIFHFPAKKHLVKRFVYIFHGLHHDDPNDPLRLLMPPLPAILIAYLLYLFFSLFIPVKYITVFMASFLTGYLLYDYIHYATHHFKMNSKTGKILKRKHLQHHFTKENMFFGVSNQIWDYVFNTKSKR